MPRRRLRDRRLLGDALDPEVRAALERMRRERHLTGAETAVQFAPSLKLNLKVSLMLIEASAFPDFPRR